MMMGDVYPATIYKEYKVLKKRTPWLALIACKKCYTHWYIGTDTDRDNFHVIQLSEEQIISILNEDIWPDDFDDIEEFWPSEGWLSICGYADLDAWKKSNR